MSPVILFTYWYQAELAQTELILPDACCLSTIGTDGFPNARFVSLKDIKNETVIITGPMDSRKGIEISNNPNVALTFWWSFTKRQIRMQGTAAKISDADADKYFAQRDTDSKIVSAISKQGKALDDVNELKALFDKKQNKLGNKEVPRPANWSGFAITPIRIEFLEFKMSRLHERTLFTKNGDVWTKQLLQP